MQERPAQLPPFERLAATVGPVGRFHEIERFQVEFMRGHGLRPEHRYLDLGCGVLRGGLPVVRFLDPGRYTGIDVDPELIEIARGRVEQEGLSDRRPTLASSPTFDGYRLQPGFDFVLAYSVLIHMHDDVMRECLRFIGEHLASDGTAFATVNVRPWREDLDEGRWKQFPVVWRPVDFYADACAAAGLTAELLELTPAEREHWRKHECLVLRHA